MKPLTMTVVAGYLGAGKTTLINRILTEDHGLRLLVMVNDFGAINIDADLLLSADKDTITLTNGCVCCAMGSDLFMALGDALDRRPRPDHLILEASGVADPVRIANAAIAEPEMRYGGIVTVVDGEQFETLAEDPLIGPQVRGQVSAADLIVASKVAAVTAPLAERLGRLSSSPVLLASEVERLGSLLYDPQPPRPDASPAHPSYAAWSYEGDATMPRAAIEASLRARPPGAFRIKGVIRGPGGEAWEVQGVGKTISVREAPESAQTRLVAIGLKARTSVEAMEVWWRRAIGD